GGSVEVAARIQVVLRDDVGGRAGKAGIGGQRRRCGRSARAENRARTGVSYRHIVQRDVAGVGGGDIVGQRVTHGIRTAAGGSLHYRQGGALHKGDRFVIGDRSRFI